MIPRSLSVSLGSVAVAGLLAAAPPPASPANDEFVQVDPSGFGAEMSNKSIQNYWIADDSTGTLANLG